MRKSSSETYVNWRPPTTSPMAQTPGAVVRRCSSTLTAPRSVSSTPALSSARSSTLGLLPVATRTASATSSVFSPPTSSESAVRSPSSRTDSVRAPRRTSMPRERRLSRTASATCSSSRGMKRVPSATMLTCEPKFAYMEANSSPM